MKKVLKIVLIVLAVVLILLGAWFFSKYRVDKVTEQYNQTINELQTTLAVLGPDVTYYEVLAEVEPGQEIKAEDIVSKTMPESFIGETFVTDVNEIIGKQYKIAITPGTPITWDMIMGEPLDDTDRDLDIVVCHYPVGLKIGDYVDIRLTMPYGEDYIVISHVRIEQLNELTIKVYLDEAQQHRYQSACVDYYLSADSGADLYMTKYIEPGLQTPAEEYYAVSEAISANMLADPNIIDKALARIKQSLRNDIENQMNAAEEEEREALNAGRNKDMSAKSSDATTYRVEMENKEAEEEELDFDLDEPIDVSPTGEDETSENLNEDEEVIE